MATAPVSRRLNLTRDQLAAFLTDQQQIRQFELMFSVVDELQVITGTDFEFQADNAAATANEALAQISRLAQALELLSTAPVIQNDNSVVTDYLDFNPQGPHVNQISRLAWNDTDQTLDLGMDYGVTQQIGQETYARVGNTTGVTIPNGTVVGFAGATTDALLVSPYLANGSQPSLYILGVMTHALPDSGEKGYCTTWGFVRDLDTSAFSVGDVLYASPSVAGGLTKVKPTAPNNVIPLAACIVSDASVGVIFVRPTIEQMKYYGIFARAADYTPAAANTAYPIVFDTTRLTNGVVLGTPASRITVPSAGLYQFNATLQFISSSATDKNIWVWYRKTGTDIANSARIVTVSVNNAYTPLSINEAVSMTASDYIELVFASSNTNVTLDAVASTAFAPAAPAVVIEVTQVQQ